MYTIWCCGETYVFLVDGYEGSLLEAYFFSKREAETLCTLSQDLQSTQTASAQQRQNILRLETKVTDLERQLAHAVTQKRTAETTLHNAETKNRALREEMAKMKVTVSQIRSQCANDIRKRDTETSRLKRHLEGRRGREGGTAQVGVVVITPGLKIGTGKGSINGSLSSEVQSPGISLRQETKNYLTELSQSLSNENEALTGLVKDTLSTLRNLQGLPSNNGDIPQHAEDPNVSIKPYVSYENLAADTGDVLEHLRALLTNPFFVPLEEVQIREEEIARLRQGWEKMEARWREALGLMDGWRKRIMETGDTINLDDLRRDLTLGAELPAALDGQITNSSILQESADEPEHDVTIIPSSSDESMLSESDVFLHVDDDATEHTLSRQMSEEISPLKKEPGKSLLPAPPILFPTSGNRRHSLSPRKVSFKAATPAESTREDPFHLVDEISLLNFSGPRSSKNTPSLERGLLKDAEVLTVQQKLATAEADAEEARKREENKGKEMEKTGLPVLKPNHGRNRRTLSPEELEDLVGYA